MQFSPFMVFILFLSFLTISYFMGILIHSALMYEDKGKIEKNSKKAWILCMGAGFGITFWMFAYGYFTNFYLATAG